MAPQIVLISGCSSGMGLATAVLLGKDAEKRFKVYATMRNLAKKGELEEEGKEYLEDTLIIKQMDVSSDESVNKAVQEILNTEGKIDVLCKYSIEFLLSTACISIEIFFPLVGHDVSNVMTNREKSNEMSSKKQGHRQRFVSAEYPLGRPKSPKTFRFNCVFGKQTAYSVSKNFFRL